MAGQKGAELPSVAELVVLVVLAVLVVLYGSSGVDPATPLLLPAPPTLRRLLLLVVEQNDSPAAAEIPRCLLVLVCRGQERGEPRERRCFAFVGAQRATDLAAKSRTSHDHVVSQERQFGQKNKC